MYTDSLLLAVMGAIVNVLIVSVVLYVLLIVAEWRILSKAGEAGWKSIVPFLNIYELYKISWETKYFWAALVCQVVLAAVQGSESGLASILASVCAIAIFAFHVLLNKRLADAYGKGFGFFVGLVLLPTIFTLILGLGDSQYQRYNRIEIDKL